MEHRSSMAASRTAIVSFLKSRDQPSFGRPGNGMGGNERVLQLRVPKISSK